ncbi:ricin B-like lectin EULS3 isoform X2 [Selaginella moellendorffii]|uniref:ricin B-like lectin EULS3 isoform X2 n=1 Tax=Selaginella moellendorffii TaxID=88036 RepID=UPI000D1D060F|nr:ricin B-like lectin EULS3 isoform X2 [Selaginella moellendorffii]|eukprot:XP_024530308.1 ricin B-like lectin EULS3 isoform X2 [Selaginella moellendorffii]
MFKTGRSLQSLREKTSRGSVTMFFFLALVGLVSRCAAQDCEPSFRSYQLRTKASSAYCLTALNETVRMNLCDSTCRNQIWFLNSTYNFVDAAGSKAFVLTNAGSGRVLRHRANDDEQVVLIVYCELSSSILWTLSPESYDKYFAIRPFENTQLNLDVDHGDRKHGGVQPNNRLMLFSWHTGDNQLWEFIEA